MTKIDRLIICFIIFQLNVLMLVVWNHTDGLNKADQSIRLLATAIKALHQ